MFHKQVVQSGEYLDLSYSAQSLYTQLCMTADDDGFTKDSTVACRLSGTGENEIHELIESGFIHRFSSGVIVIIHWKINNEIKPDRYHETKFSKEKLMTRVDENKVIQIKEESGTSLEPERNQNGTTKGTEIAQYSIAQPSINSPVKPSREQEGEHREGGHPEPEWKDVLKAASDKGVSISNYQVITRLNMLKGQTSCSALIDRINSDEEFIEQLKRL